MSEYRLFSELSSCLMIEVSDQEDAKWVNLHVVETEWEVKNFHKNFHEFLKGGGGGRRGRNIEQIELRVTPKTTFMFWVMFS